MSSITTGASKMPNSTQKIALITGGNRGLGRNPVLSLAQRGIDSIFTYNSNRTEAEKSLAACPSKSRPRR
jgi:NAD(P)-dependent dehydrogenase (short-subunit alcohol dehydrogenase family)